MPLPRVPAVRCVLLSAVMLLALRAPAASAAIAVTPSGIDGGGFTTVFVRTPCGLLLGSDTRSGFHQTSDTSEKHLAAGLHRGL